MNILSECYFICTASYKNSWPAAYNPDRWIGHTFLRKYFSKAAYFLTWLLRIDEFYNQEVKHISKNISRLLYIVNGLTRSKPHLCWSSSSGHILHTYTSLSQIQRFNKLLVLVYTYSPLWWQWEHFEIIYL